ncbi:MAG: hypothetical protein ABF893_04300 [Gluconacetobacter liquefaciens]
MRRPWRPVYMTCTVACLTAGIGSDLDGFPSARRAVSAPRLALPWMTGLD